MKEIIVINSDKLALVDDEDFELCSQYTWRVYYQCYFPDKPRCLIGTNGPPLGDRRRNITMHRLVYGDIEGMIDHINTDIYDNRKGNLRPATNQQNQANSRAQRNASSRFKGVSFVSSRNVSPHPWIASI